MAIPVSLFFDEDKPLNGSEFRITVVDERLMEKIPLIRALRNLTGSTLMSSKHAIETLQEHGSIIFNAPISLTIELCGTKVFEDLGVHLTKEVGEVDEYDIEGQRRQRLASLIERLPTLPVREDPTCEQLADLMMVAHRLGMHGAAEALNLWLESVKKAQPPASHYAPMG